MSSDTVITAQQTGLPTIPFNPAQIAGSIQYPNINLASLYVGELKPEVTEQTLWNVFSPHGQVMSVRVCRDSQTQGSLGYAYINFRSTPEAEKAMEQVNFTHIEGKPCRVMWSMRDATRRKFGIGNLFIKNIDPNLDAKSLYQAFSAFGPVLSCKIALDEYGLSKGYGFIQFYNEKDSEKARERSNGVKFSKKKLVVAKFIPKSERKDAKPVNPEEFTNVFIKNFANWSDAQLKKMFEKFGEITSAIVQKGDKNECLGYGFVNYANHEAAVRAIDEMNDFQCEDGNKITVCRAMKKLERQAFLRRQYEERKRETYKKFQNMNLYIKNFDENVTDDKLADMFKEFGEIKSAHVMKDEGNRSRCFGFVCFSKPEEADKALNAMNLKVYEGKPLYVSHAQSKEERRRLFEQQTYNNSFRGPLIAPPSGIPYMYPPPATFGYQQFPRYQTSNRTNRSQGQNYNNNQNTRTSNYFNGNNYQQNYRSRGNSNVRQNYRQNQQVTVNHVVAEPAKKKEEVKVTQRQIPDARADFKNRVFSLAQELFAQRGYDQSALSRVSGIVIDYYLTESSSTANVEDKSIKEAVNSAYKSVGEENAPAK